MKYVKNPENNKCSFAVTRTGDPIKIQRTIFSECFYMIAMAELARATGDAKYKVTLNPTKYCTVGSDCNPVIDQFGIGLDINFKHEKYL